VHDRVLLEHLFDIVVLGVVWVEVLHIDEVTNPVLLLIEDLVHESRQLLGVEHVGHVFFAEAIDVDGVIVGGAVIRVRVIHSLDGAVLSIDGLDGLRNNLRRINYC